MRITWKTVRTSFSMLSREERARYFAILIGRVSLQFLDLGALALVGLLAAMTAARISGDEFFRVLDFAIPLDRNNIFIGVVGGISMLFLLKSVLSMLFLRHTALFVAKVEARVSCDLVRYLFSGTLTRTQERSRSEVNFAAGKSANAAISGVLNPVASLVGESALFVLVFASFLVVNPPLAVSMVAYFTGIVLVLQRVISPRIRSAGLRIKETTIATTRNLLDLSDTFREVSVLAREGFFLDRYAMHRRLQATEAARQHFFAGVPRYFLEVALMAGVFLFLMWQISSDGIEAKFVDFSLLLVGGTRLMAGLVPLQAAVLALRISGPLAAESQTIFAEMGLNSKLESDQPDSAAVADGMQLCASPTLEVRDVSFRYPGASADVVRNVSLSFKGPGVLAIVGRSGAGKSTLVELILGLSEVSAGEILIDGRNVKSLRMHKRGVLSYVPQRPGLVSGSIAENIAIGIPPENIDMRRIMELVQLVGLDHGPRTSESDFSADLGPMKDSLSGGETQRIGLARALYKSPRLLVLDEATSALDAESEALVGQVISRVSKSIIVLVIAHRLSTVQFADEILLLDEGVIAAKGDFNSLRESSALFNRYVKLLSFKD